MKFTFLHFLSFKKHFTNPLSNPPFTFTHHAGTQAFTKVTPPDLEPANEVLDAVQGFGLPSIGFIEVFIGTILTVSFFFLIMIVQETVEWNAFMSSEKNGWAYLFSFMSFYCQIVSGPGLIPIVKQLFRAIDCTHHTITNETIAEDQAIFQKCVGKLQHAPMVVTQERDYGNTVCLQESKWICSSSNGSALTGFMNDSVTFGNVTTSTVNAVETGGLLNNLYGETVWRMDSNECVECWVGVSLFEENIFFTIHIIN